MAKSIDRPYAVGIKACHKDGQVPWLVIGFTFKFRPSVCLQVYWRIITSAHILASQSTDVAALLVRTMYSILSTLYTFLPEMRHSGQACPQMF